MKLLQIVTIIVYTLKIVGLAPFSKSGNTSVFSFSKAGFAYNLLLSIAIQVMTAIGIPAMFAVSFTGRSIMTLVIDVAMSVAACVTSTTVIIFSAFWQNNAVCIINKLLEIDSLLSGVENAPLSSKRIFKTFAVQIILSVSPWIVFLYSKPLLISGNLLIWLFLVPLLVIYCFIIEYSLVVSLLTMNLGRMNNNLSALDKFPNFVNRSSLSNENFSTYDPLAAIKLLHTVRTMLFEASQDVADFFSFPILLSIGFYFCIIVHNVHFLISFALDSSIELSILGACAGISPVLIAIHPIVLLSVNISKALDEAKQTRRIVHKLMAIPMRQNVKAMLRQFSLQLLHEHVSFTAYGFFTLDCTMLHSVLGATSTYLVMLIQFEPSDHALKSTLSTQNTLCGTNCTIGENIK